MNAWHTTNQLHAWVASQETITSNTALVVLGNRTVSVAIRQVPMIIAQTRDISAVTEHKPLLLNTACALSFSLNATASQLQP